MRPPLSSLLSILPNPPVCLPNQLHLEVEPIFGAPPGSLVVYEKSSSVGSNELKCMQEEINDAYYVSNAIVQRVEYVLRGLNATHVARGLKAGAMALSTEGEGNKGEEMAKNDCFSAMLNLIVQMKAEGGAYEALRFRVVASW